MSDIELSAKLDRWIDDNTVDSYFIAHPDFVYDKLLELETEIKKLQAENAELNKQSQWISVEDELPKEGVMVALHGGDIERLGLKTTAGFYDSYYRCFQALLEEGELELCDACFWMPLPTPPEGE